MGRADCRPLVGKGGVVGTETNSCRGRELLATRVAGDHES